MNYKNIGVVIADKDEYRPFAKTIENAAEVKFFNMQAIAFTVGNTRVTAVLSGIGKVNAATATTCLINHGCDLILNFGLSGGLSGVKTGVFCLPDTFLEHDFDLSGIGYKLCEKPGQDYIYKANTDVLKVFSAVINIPAGGTAVTGDSFICDEQKSAQLFKNFSANCCDMETAAIASVCHAAGVPFAVLRRISDDAGENAGETYRDINMNEGEMLGSTFLKCLTAVAGAEESRNG